MRKVIRAAQGEASEKKAGTMASWVNATIIILLTLFSGCNKDKPNWYAEARSPSGEMVATATTWEQGGFGTDTNQTVVRLNWTGGSQKPTIILIFDDKLDASVNTKVGMKWLSPNQLVLAYSGDRYVNFLASRCDAVDITLQRLPDGTDPTKVP
jgi:hypothetical protein